MKSVMWVRACAPLALIGLFAACVDSELPPEPTRQVAVPYGERIYLKDDTIGDRPNRCALLGEVVRTSSTSTPTVGGDVLMDPQRAYNCYVEVQPGELMVDVIETTNALFQLCVDSTVCKKPDPVDVDKAPVCSDEDLFDTCPVVSVQHLEAQRFCEFIGRRLPSMLEHIVMRQQNMPQDPKDVELFATGNTAPTSCDQAVLKDCGRPAPMTVNTDETIGAARLDKTTQGVYDLTGNAGEWARDLLPALRGAAADLPWFCVAPLGPDDVDQDGFPRCPDGEVCIKGEYLANGETRSDYPVCITSRDLDFVNGTVGSIMGGNYATTDPTPLGAGIFSRIEREKPNAEDATHGFRCVGVSGQPGGIVAR